VIPPVTLVAPIIFTGLVAASWALRPLARRDDFAGCAASSRSRTIAYWVTTGLLALECGVGGVMGALRLPPFSEIMKHLGYPTFFMTIIGVWYILGALAILAPRFPRLKEWAYAGLVFIYSGAVASPSQWLIAPSRWWPRSSSPASWPPPGPCVRRLVASW
jgi:uncharacterized membrane protein YphA (DoxX/SURF4 family)